MITAILVILAVIGLVLVSRYLEVPKDRRPSLNPWKWLRGKAFPPKYSYRVDESAKRFAEQWGSHPTLSNRRARAIKRSLRKKNRRAR